MGALGAVKALAIGTGALVAAYSAVAYQLGQAAFESFAFKESALATGRALWGSAEAADAMFKKASALARLTPFNVQEVATGFNRLGAAGFKADEVPVVFQGLADIASMSGRGSEAIGMMTLAFSQMMGKGKLMSQELNQITEAAGGAVSRLKLFDEIAKIMGVNASQIESLMENGLIPARVAIMGIMQVSKNLGGGILGANSIAQSKTLAGLWSNLQDAVSNLWLTMDLSKAPWFQTVKRFLTNIIDALDTSTESGQRLQGVFDRMFGRFFGMFEDLTLDDLINALDTASHYFGVFMEFGRQMVLGLWEGFSSATRPLRTLMDMLGETGLMSWSVGEIFGAIGRIIGGVITLGGIMMMVFGPILAVISKVFNILFDIASVLATGVVGSIAAALTGDIGALWDVGIKMGQGLKEGFGNAIEAHSPSKVFERYGGNVVDGFNRGVDSTSGMDATLGESLAAGAGGGGGRSASGGVSVSLTVNLNSTGQEDGDSIAQRIADATTSTLANFFDSLAAERGLA